MTIYTREQIDTVVQLDAGGMSLDLIARRVGTSRQTITKHLGHLLRPRPERRRLPQEIRDKILAMSEQGMSAPQIAKTIDVPYNRVRNFLDGTKPSRNKYDTHSTRRRMDEDVCLNIVRLWAKGVLVSEISERVGFCESHVHKVIKDRSDLLERVADEMRPKKRRVAPLPVSDRDRLIRKDKGLLASLARAATPLRKSHDETQIAAMLGVNIGTLNRALEAAQ